MGYIVYHSMFYLYISTVDRLLTADDYREVYSMLYPQRLQWYPIGLQINVPHDVLENLKAECRENEQCLQKMLLYWLRMKQTMRPTWQALIDALRCKTVGNEGAADDLQKYLTSRASEGNVSASLSHSVQLYLTFIMRLSCTL